MKLNAPAPAAVVAVPSLSVLMPVWNPEPAYLGPAIESILGQSFGDFELIISEDPGERTGNLVISAFRDPRIVYQVNSHRTRLIHQRNQGLASARATLVALADSDDICEPTRFEQQVAYLKTHLDVGVVSSQLTIVDQASNVIGFRRYPLEHVAIVRALQLYNPIAQPAVMFRKRLVEEIGGYTYTAYDVNSDYDLWCRLAKTGARFAVLDEALVRYRIHPSALKTARLREVIAATIDIKRRHFGDQLSVGAHARLALERLLLCLPPAVVLKLFTMTQYRAPPRKRQDRREGGIRAR